MKSLMIAALLFCVLVSCKAGTVFVASGEADAIRTSYQDPRLSELAGQNQPLLKDIYKRVQANGVDVYPSGIGFTDLLDDQGRKYHYLLVGIRPPEIVFDEGHTTPEARFNEVLRRQFERYMTVIRADDMRVKGIDGLAFAVYWPVRDFAKCDQNGGFLEYITIYFPKDAFLGMTNRTTSFMEAVSGAEVVTSLALQPAKSVKVAKPE